MLLLLPLLLANVEGEGTLHLTLDRYANDTCGGFTVDSNRTGYCSYYVTLRVAWHYTRVNERVILQKQYRLPGLKTENYYVKFPRDATGRDIPNPVAVLSSGGEVNVTFSVTNVVKEELFSKQYSVQTDALHPNEETGVTDHINIGGLLTIIVKLECGEHFIGVGCATCDAGWYGSKCDVECIENSNYTCNNVTGDKLCNAGYYGDLCDKHCIGTTNYTCTKDGTRLCNYPAIGPTCNESNACPGDWYGRNCTDYCRPEHGRYTCGTHGEKICQGAFSGANCSACLPHHYGPNCSRICAPHAARYNCSRSGLRECAENWDGEECGTCAEFWSGPECEVLCNPTTNPLRYTCDEYGVRMCLGMWRGAACDTCSPSYYGHNCQVFCNATTQWKCDKDSGEFICKNNRTGSLCEECVGGYTAFNDPAFPGQIYCVHCVETQQFRCNSRGGRVCKEDWYGRDCTHYCRPEPGRYTCGTHGEKICQGAFSGTYCSECRHNYYLPDCSRLCVPAEYKTCTENGTAICARNRYGPDCAVFCNESSPLLNCTESGAVVCIGDRDPATRCETCTADHYTDACDVTCFAGPNQQCNESTGILSCLENWSGANCTECAADWYTEDCSELCRNTTDYSCSMEGVLELRWTVYGWRSYVLNVGLIVGAAVLFNVLAICAICKFVPRLAKQENG